MSRSTNSLIIRRIYDDIKTALQSGNILSLQNNLSLLPPIDHTDGSQVQQRTHLVKEIEKFILQCIEKATLQNNYELFSNAVDLYKSSVMLNDATARRNYAALIQEYNPRFNNFFHTPEEKQDPEVLGKIITPISEKNFRAKVADPETQLLLKSATYSATK